MKFNLDIVQRAMLGLSLRRPRTVVLVAILITVVLGALMVRVEVDTDPENMLPGDDPVRQLNHSIREDFGISDTIVVGIIDEEGVLTPQTMTVAARLGEDIRELNGVIADGVVSFNLAAEIPPNDLSEDDVNRIANAVDENALFAGRVIAPDDQGIAIYVPLDGKGAADDVSSSIEGLIEAQGETGSTEFYVAGLPLAEEVFGRDMFVQMALLAPLAGLLLFLLMLFFFRRLTLVVAAMLVAMLSVIWSMGLLIGTGFTVHIMSSMIPIFLMPIAVLDSVHILSEFFDRYPIYRDRRETLRIVYKELFVPITYTTLTTAVAFGSLAIAPIPPVRVFGVFVAFGVVVAWLLTMLFIPAYIMLMSEEGLKRSLASKPAGGSAILARSMRWLGGLTMSGYRVIIPAFVVLGMLAIPGVAQITVNDNPVRWFKSGSEIRQATDAFNRHFPGTYTASLVLEAEIPGAMTEPEAAMAVADLQRFWSDRTIVGSTTSYVDAITTTNYLTSGRQEEARTVPGNQAGIEELIEVVAASPGGGLVNSLLTDDYRKANLQIQMRDGDNLAMDEVVGATETYLSEQPLPDGIRASWAGESYLNLVWQDKMVSGMLRAFLSTFVVVLVLMMLLFRSVRWGLIAMIPMSATILFVYGAIGYSGKDYDMPIAVLSTMVLGIGSDFAIHFISRYRELASRAESSQVALGQVFEEPARALTRNMLIIAVGFLPLFFASLVPYIVVGALLSSMMVLSWLVTLILLPALIALFNRNRDVQRAGNAEGWHRSIKPVGQSTQTGDHS